ncbi:hypothetical protein M430DRAFT_31264 [Amorphotheca resinae ATCC 22711]|uniref:Uncharacterized protein n=1 Tax=Amorphotheca resinae ATCC 22711 TaxID=857342 RepID=A0A2T3AQK5_AMORE|nr:hypothetical protein M430DRAFT_31264 [Amorphotheca resinae ATCC 22711]PSS08543.1 hypothetical protein M430DRAFT_31264 [Amorphotheca resinae ATCC 22711]
MLYFLLLYFSSFDRSRKRLILIESVILVLVLVNVNVNVNVNVKKVQKRREKRKVEVVEFMYPRSLGRITNCLSGLEAFTLVTYLSLYVFIASIGERVRYKIDISNKAFTSVLLRDKSITIVFYNYYSPL